MNDSSHGTTMPDEYKYIGSVRFFRHVIVLFCALVLLLSTAGFFIMLAKNTRLAAENAELTRQIAGTGASATSEKDTRKIPPLAASIAYQKKYPELYCPAAPAEIETKGAVFLTFDDGPSRLTGAYLDALAKHGVKATFFVVGKNIPGNEELLLRMAREGHAIGVHTYSHKYGDIYASVESYLEDFNKTWELIYKTTGVKPEVFRFPGGSVNFANRKIYHEVIAEMLRRRFLFYDWNVTAADTAPNASAKAVYDNVTGAAQKGRGNIILMHDSLSKSLGALEHVIINLKGRGYVFDRLTRSVVPFAFYY